MERTAPDLQGAGYALDRERTAAQSRIQMGPGDEQRRFIGLDVHAETIAVAVAEAGGEVGSLGTIPNRPDLHSSHSLRISA